MPATVEEREALVDKISLFKAQCSGGPILSVLLSSLTSCPRRLRENNVDLYAPEASQTEVMAIHYRAEESIFIKPSYDRVTVIFSTVFKD